MQACWTSRTRRAARSTECSTVWWPKGTRKTKSASAAPVRDVRNQVAAEISVASAVPYMPDDRMAELGPIVRATADAISKELGWKTDRRPP